MKKADPLRREVLRLCDEKPRLAATLLGFLKSGRADLAQQLLDQADRAERELRAAPRECAP